MKLRILLFILLFSLSFNNYSQTIGDYRTSGTPADLITATNWQTWDGTLWVTTTNPPTSVPKGNTITIQATHSVTNSTAGTTLNAQLIVNGSFTIKKDLNTLGIIVNGSVGKISLIQSSKLYVYGDFVVNLGGTFSAWVSGNNATLVVYGDFIDYGKVEFWTSSVVIIGSLLAQGTPAITKASGNGTVVVLGDLTGQFGMLGSGSAEIYTLNPNATVNLVNSSSVLMSPGTDISLESTSYKNLVSATTGTCAFQVQTIWNGSTWSNGFPAIAKEVILAADYSGSFSACSITVNPSVTLTINSGDYINVNNVITNNGTIVVEDGGSIAQINNPTTNNSNFSGNSITYKRKTTAIKQYDYVYWASPVINATLGQLATNWGFYSFNTSTNQWVNQPSTATMNPGIGYIARSVVSSAGLTTCFSGVPNNGNIPVSVVKSALSISNLIGNPYPCAVDLDKFITANSAAVGTVYLWTHNTAITNNVYTVNDYAKYNLTGGVAASSGGAVPTGKIAAGQSFFIDSSRSTNGTTSATFKNSMRRVTNNNQFFRTTATKTSNVEKNRVWVSLSNTQGASNQMLLGYITGATDKLDNLYDGKTLSTGNSISIYTVLGNNNLSIQGRALPFSSNDVVPVGYTSTIEGLLTIHLENFDGLFVNQNIYLFDKTSNTYSNLKTGNYTFTTTSGTFNNRFELRFVIKNLDEKENSREISNDIEVSTDKQQLYVSSSLDAISKVSVYDLLGKLLYTGDNLNTNYFQTDSLLTSSQIVIVRVTLKNEQTFTKKIITK